jgi:hypothetical protein
MNLLRRLAQTEMKSLLVKKLYFFAGTERPAEAPETALKNTFFDQKLGMKGWNSSRKKSKFL